jgi:membrane protease YdiL (CAAX protease family)
MSDLGHDKTLRKAFEGRSTARREPKRPLLEAALLLAAFYLPAYMPWASAFAPRDMTKASYHLSLIAVDLPRMLLVLYLMTASDGLGPFGVKRITARDPLRALFTALGAMAIVLFSGLCFSLFGLQNPLMAIAQSAPRAQAMLVPLVLVSSVAVGYCEELFFRSYLMRRLGQAGLSLFRSAIASSLVFGAGHGYQGIIGIVSGSLLGLYFVWRWIDGGNIHEIGLGHGLYDAVVTAIAIYS